jgi:tocopherol O-methyltransferase
MKPLNERIRDFYDGSTQLWLNTWGEHMHHGYYGLDGSERKDHQQAQLDLITESLKWAGVESANRILDAGCGVGGSARVLAQLYDASVLGLTLSPVQAERGNHYSAEAGLAEKVVLRAQDMMTLQPEDGPFDFIWSMESAEHIRDKKGMLQLFYDSLQPGGQMLVITWCHRPLPPELSPKEKALLEKIYRLYHLPPMISLPDYAEHMKAVGFRDIATADWSASVAPFWKAVIRTALSPAGFRGLLQSNWSTIKGAWAMRYMTQGFQKGILSFGLMRGTK